MKSKTLFWVVFVMMCYLIHAIGLFFVLDQYGNSVFSHHPIGYQCPHHCLIRTAKTQYRNLKQIFPEKELRGHSPNSYIHVSVSDLYIPTIGRLPILLQGRLWEYIDRSQTHECGHCDWGRAIPFLEIHRSKFLCIAVSISVSVSFSAWETIFSCYRYILNIFLILENLPIQNCILIFPVNLSP